ncbi:MAG: hypothetical protein HY253_12880 [Burkholderiales bacterium]|nr:hypothetical protein [Burkholderiales bacterium]
MSRSDTLPLSLEAVKRHLSISHFFDDERLKLLTWTAIDFIENECNVAICNSVWQQSTPNLGTTCQPYTGRYHSRNNGIRLLHYPVLTLDHCYYWDSDNNPQEFNTDNLILLHDYRYPSFVQLKYGATQPVAFNRPDSFTLEYSVGYGEAEITVTGDEGTTVTSSLPAGLQHAVMMLVSELNENRESSVTGSIQAATQIGLNRLLAPYKMEGWQ